MKSNFWLYNKKELLDKKKIHNFIPLISMSLEEKLNSITRFSLYLSIILTIMSCNLNYIYLFIGTVVLSYIFYIFNVKTNENTKENTITNGYFNNIIKNSVITNNDMNVF